MYSNKAKKGLLLLVVLLGFFPFSGIAVTQQQHQAAQTEAFYQKLPHIKSALSYKRASLSLHKQNHWFLNNCNVVATANHSRLVSLRYKHQKQIVRLLPSRLLQRHPARTDLELPTSSQA